MVVPYIEGNNELIALYRKDLAKFWTTILDPASKVVFLIIDGAHRWKMCQELVIVKLFAVFMRPEISVGEMVQMLHCC